jgi:DNA-binding MarR family transcriptional regulator
MSAGAAFSLASSASHLLHRAQQYAADRFLAELGGVDFTLRQFALLAAISIGADQSQTDLVRATGIDRSTLADMIGRMEKRGLVSRKTAANDRRAKTVALTAAGKRALDQAAPAAAKADAALMDALPKTQVAAFNKALAAIAEVAAKAHELEDGEAAPRRRPVTRATSSRAKAKPARAPKAVAPAARGRKKSAK